MKLKDILNLDEAFFNPPVGFDGEWVIGAEEAILPLNEDYLYLNAIKDNDGNRYQRLTEEKYYKPLRRILGSNSIADQMPCRILTTEDKDGRRCLKFSFWHYYMANLLTLVEMNDVLKRKDVSEGIDEQDMDACIEKLKSLLKEERKKYNDVSKNGIKSPYSEQITQVYHDSKNDLSFTFQEFMYASIDSLTQRIVACKYLKEFFDRTIDEYELLNCFEFDKLALCLAKSCMNAMKVHEASTGEVCTSSNYLYYYFRSVEILRKINPNYDCSINIFNDETSKFEKISIDDIKEEYYEALKRHPEFCVYEFTVDQVFPEGISNVEFEKLSPNEVRARVEKFVDARKKLGDLEASWEIFPKGEMDSKDKGKNETQGYKPTYQISENEKYRRSMTSHNFLESQSYLYRMYGINEFTGYNAYVFPTGKVILEKQMEEDFRKSSATYVMNLENFVELSKLSRQQLKEKIGNNELEGVTRIYHVQDMDSWKRKIMSHISGERYTDEVKSYINKLVTNEVIKKKEK